MRMLSPFFIDRPWPRRSLASDFNDDLFERLFDVPSPAANFQASCDVSETKGHYLICFDMPGVRKEDIKVELSGNQLVVSGERHREVKSAENEEMVRHYERAHGKFQRSFTLPTSVDADKIEAHYEDGVLNIALPKSDQAKGRTVQIQSGKGGNLFSRLMGKNEEKVAL